MIKRITFSKDTENEMGPSIKFDDPKSQLEEVMKRYDRQTYLIIGVLIVSFIIMITMVATLLIDSFHINSATYREYSVKMESVKSNLETNSEFLNQNRKNQELIIQQQKQIRELLNKLN